MNTIERPLQLILIRHGESLRNKAKQGTIYFADEETREIVRGIPDHEITLTQEGIRQAKETGIYLRDHFDPPDYFYHSGYARTIQTLEEILKAFPAEIRCKIKVRMNAFIRERDPGHTYDMTAKDVERAFPWLESYWRTFGGFFARPPGGESLADVSQRVYTFLNTLFRDRFGKRIWVSLHGGTLRAFRFLLEHWTYEQALRWPDDQSPKNCGITVYSFCQREGRLILGEYNTVGWKQ